MQANIPRKDQAEKVRIERTRDYALLDEIGTSPEIYAAAAEDDNPLPADCHVPRGEPFFYLMAYSDSQRLGYVMFWPRKDDAESYDCHLCFLPHAYGVKAERAFRLAIDWLWQHTQAVRIHGSVPEFNRRAVIFALHAGFRVVGAKPEAFRKNTMLHDVILLELDRPGGGNA